VSILTNAALNLSNPLTLRFRNAKSLGRVQPIAMKKYEWHSAGPMRSLPGRTDETCADVTADKHRHTAGQIMPRMYSGLRHVTGGGYPLTHKNEGNVNKSSDTDQVARPAESRPWRHLTPQEQHMAIAKGINAGYSQPHEKPPQPLQSPYRLPAAGSWDDRAQQPPIEAWTETDRPVKAGRGPHEENQHEHMRCGVQVAQATEQNDAAFAGSSGGGAPGPWTDADGTVHMADGRTLEKTRPGYTAPRAKTIKEVSS